MSKNKKTNYIIKGKYVLGGRIAFCGCRWPPQNALCCGKAGLKLRAAVALPPIFALNEESYISSADGLNPNKITAEDQTTAIDKAQEEMKKSIEDNFDLMTTAQERAKELIEAYIIQLGTEAGVEYNITWVEIPNQPIETPAV